MEENIITSKDYLQWVPYKYLTYLVFWVLIVSYGTSVRNTYLLKERAGP